MKFEEFGLHQSILQAISYMGFVEATPIQEQAIPIILEGNDIIGCAQTGTGKTGAFLLPVLNTIIEKDDHAVRALIVVPTRELALQIDQQLEGITYGTGITSIAIYGGTDGMDWSDQKTALKDGADIVIATPGKLQSHLNLGYVNLDKLAYFILDEADRMLDIGFHDDIINIMTYLPEDRQNLMFSATMPPKIRSFAKKILNDPKEISIAVSKPAEGVLQASYLTYDKQKLGLIAHLLNDKPEYSSIIIFCSTKKSVAETWSQLRKQGFSVARISSDLDQNEREEVMRKFKAKQTRIIVATDVISRGIDIQDINLVINYNVPGDAEDYVHRIGRTARASTTGVAITLINPKEMNDFAKIEKLIEKEVFKMPVPDQFGESPTWKVSSYSKKKGGKKRFTKKRR